MDTNKLANTARIIAEQMVIAPLWSNARLLEMRLTSGSTDLDIMLLMRAEYEQELSNVKRNWYACVDEIGVLMARLQENEGNVT